MRVLLIEPDRVIARTITTYVQPDHEVIRANDVQTAIHAFDTSHIDLVVTELELAGHNGIEFLYELRSYEDLQQIPVILYTSLKPDPMSRTMIMQSMQVTMVLDKAKASLKDIKRAIDSIKVEVR